MNMFRMLSARGLEMYDGHSFDQYDVQVGDTIRIETWDGVNNFLVLCQRGFAKNALAELDKETDANILRYLLRVALYLAAHFGHLDLASATIKFGVIPEEGVGKYRIATGIADFITRTLSAPPFTRPPNSKPFPFCVCLFTTTSQTCWRTTATSSSRLTSRCVTTNHQKISASLLIAKQ